MCYETKKYIMLNTVDTEKERKEIKQDTTTSTIT